MPCSANFNDFTNINYFNTHCRFSQTYTFSHIIQFRIRSYFFLLFNILSHHNMRYLSSQCQNRKPSSPNTTFNKMFILHLSFITGLSNFWILPNLKHTTTGEHTCDKRERFQSGFMCVSCVCVRVGEGDNNFDHD